jgi:predicted RNA binding protein YcfA (HicA-like mRNA interferase family)
MISSTLLPTSSLFKARKKGSHEEIFFNSFQEACEWKASHRFLKNKKSSDGLFL